MTLIYFFVLLSLNSVHGGKIILQLKSMDARNISLAMGDLILIVGEETGKWQICEGECHEPKTVLAESLKDYVTEVDVKISGRWFYTTASGTNISFTVAIRVLKTVLAPGYFDPTETDFYQVAVGVDCNLMQLNGEDLLRKPSVYLVYCTEANELRFSSVQLDHLGTYSRDDDVFFTFTIIKERLNLYIDAVSSNPAYIVFPSSTLVLISKCPTNSRCTWTLAGNLISSDTLNQIFIDEKNTLVINNYRTSDGPITFQIDDQTPIVAKVMPIYDTQEISVSAERMTVNSVQTFTCTTKIDKILLFSLYVNDILQDSAVSSRVLNSKFLLSESIFEVKVRCEILFSYYSGIRYNFTEIVVPVWKTIVLNSSKHIFVETLHSNFILNLHSVIEEIGDSSWFVDGGPITPTNEEIKLKNLKDAVNIKLKQNHSNGLQIDFIIIPASVFDIAEARNGQIYLPSEVESEVSCVSTSDKVSNLRWDNIDKSEALHSESRDLVFDAQEIKYNGIYTCIASYDTHNRTVYLSKSVNVSFYVSSPKTTEWYMDELKIVYAEWIFPQNVSWFQLNQKEELEALPSLSLTRMNDLIVRPSLLKQQIVKISVTRYASVQISIEAAKATPQYSEYSLNPANYRIGDRLNLSCLVNPAFLDQSISLFVFKESDFNKSSLGILKNQKAAIKIINSASVGSSSRYYCVTHVVRHMIAHDYTAEMIIDVKGYEPIEPDKSVYMARFDRNGTVNLTCGLRKNTDGEIAVVWMDVNDTQLKTEMVKSEQFAFFTEIFYSTSVVISNLVSTTFKCMINIQGDEPIFSQRTIAAVDKPKINISLTKNLDKNMVKCRVRGYFDQVTLLDASNSVLVNQKDLQESYTDINLSYVADNLFTDDIYTCVVHQVTDSGSFSESESVYSVAVYRSTGTIVGITLMLIGVFGLVICGICMLSTKPRDSSWLHSSSAN